MPATAEKKEPTITEQIEENRAKQVRLKESLLESEKVLQEHKKKFDVAEWQLAFWVS